MEFDLNAVDFHVSFNTGDEVELEDVQEWLVFEDIVLVANVLEVAVLRQLSLGIRD